MKARKIMALGLIVTVLSTAAFGAQPSEDNVMEEILVAAPYPARLLMEEIVVTAPTPVNLLAEHRIELTVEEIGIEPDITFTL